MIRLLMLLCLNRILAIKGILDSLATTLSGAGGIASGESNLLSGGVSGILNTASSLINTDMISQLGSAAMEAQGNQQTMALLEDQETAATALEELENHVVSLQNDIEKLSSSVFNQREFLVLAAKEKQFLISAAIANTAKLLRAYYDQKYPDRVDKPLFVVPTSELTDALKEAEDKVWRYWQLYQTGEREGECVQTAATIMLMRSNSEIDDDKEFLQLAEILFQLDPHTRLKESAIHRAWYSSQLQRAKKILNDISSVAVESESSPITSLEQEE